jgi:hypothetical protein
MPRTRVPTAGPGPVSWCSTSSDAANLARTRHVRSAAGLQVEAHDPDHAHLL